MPGPKQPNPYQPLLDHLAASSANEVTLTFREIAAMIGRPLPETAILQNGWWSSRSTLAVKRWQELGWRARADRDHLRVVFTRSSEE